MQNEKNSFIAAFLVDVKTVWSFSFHSIFFLFIPSRRILLLLCLWCLRADGVEERSVWGRRRCKCFISFILARRLKWNIAWRKRRSLRGNRKLDGEIFLVRGAGECKHSYSSHFQFSEALPCFISDFLWSFSRSSLRNGRKNASSDVAARKEIRTNVDWKWNVDGGIGGRNRWERSLRIMGFAELNRKYRWKKVECGFDRWI